MNRIASATTQMKAERVSRRSSRSASRRVQGSSQAPTAITVASAAGTTDTATAWSKPAAHPGSRALCPPQNAAYPQSPRVENPQNTASTTFAIVGIAGDIHQPSERSGLARTQGTYRRPTRIETLAMDTLLDALLTFRALRMRK